MGRNEGYGTAKSLTYISSQIKGGIPITKLLEKLPQMQERAWHLCYPYWRYHLRATLRRDIYGTMLLAYNLEQHKK